MMIGNTLGGYRIVEQIGRGGMATVYKAFDPRNERYVAIKTLPPQYLEDETFRIRFEQEAKSIAQLEHVHILPMFGSGEEDGFTYMVMRYLDTGTLAEYIQENGALSFAEATRILSQMASALNYAHQNNVLHRDVKPSNILLDNQGNAFLTDFGIAKMVDGSGPDLTGTGLIGTPRYMSPEQCLGRKDLTPTSDQYALGIILYEMLTGQAPFDAETPLAIIQKHVSAPLPPPCNLRSDLPESAQNVLLKALAREPDARYESCNDFAQAFKDAIDTATLSANMINGTPTIVPIANETMPHSEGDGGEQTLTTTFLQSTELKTSRRNLWIGALGTLAIIIVIYGTLSLFNTDNSHDATRPPENADLAFQQTQTFIPTSSDEATIVPTATRPSEANETAENTSIPTNALTVSMSLTQLPTAISAVTEVATHTPIPQTTETKTVSDGSLDITAVYLNSEWKPVFATVDYNDYLVEVALVPPGCFNIGSTQEDIAYYVELGADEGSLDDELGGQDEANTICFDTPWWIDRYEVSEEQYTTIQSIRPLIHEGNLPVVNISALDASAFCELREGRLPTEAEWEFAARGPDEWHYPWGDEVNAEWFNTLESANVDGYANLAPVTAYEEGASWVGALNMVGNASEWTSTLWHEYPYASQYEDSTDLEAYHTFRSGSFNVPIGYVHATVRAGFFAPTESDSDIGFRCVLDNLPEPTE